MGLTLRDLIQCLDVVAKEHPELLDKKVKFRRFVGNATEETNPISGLCRADGQLCLVDDYNSRRTNQ